MYMHVRKRIFPIHMKPSLLMHSFGNPRVRRFSGKNTDAQIHHWTRGSNWLTMEDVKR